MSRPPRESVEFVRAALFVLPTSERLEALRKRTTDAALDWDELLPKLEYHGILGLVHRNTALAGRPIPEPERLQAVRADAKRLELTVAELVEAGEAEGVQFTLLKGASLALDTYACDPSIRAAGDLDVLVTPGEVSRAARAAESLGLGLIPAQLPRWWYRFAHFHLKLSPKSPLLKDVEIHWALHHPSLVLTADPHQLRARSLTKEVNGHIVRVLDPYDRFLHLVTHLHSHGDVPELGDPLETLLASPAPDLRLKWILDLIAERDRLSGPEFDRIVTERAEAFGAIATWRKTQKFLQSIEQAQSAALPAAVSQNREEPHAAFDFRLGSLRRLPKWLWPPGDYIRQRYQVRSLPVAFLVRVGHAVGVALRVASAMLLLPAALVGRWLLRRSRVTHRAKPEDPATILDLVSAYRERGGELPKAKQEP